MKALRFHGRGDLRLESVAEPAAPVASEVLTAPLKCGICGTDLHEFLEGPLRVSTTPHPLTGASLPQILGHELSAEVIEVGEQVEGLSPGDRVSVMPLISCGQCGPCRGGNPQHCALRAAVGLRHRWGGMSELALVDASQLTKLPDDLSDEQGALIEPSAVATAAVALARLRPGDPVLVTGAGPIGMLAALAARRAGAGEVLISELGEGRAQLASRIGFDVVDPSKHDVEELCRQRWEDGAAAAIECSGSESALRTALEAIRPSGRVVQAGLLQKPVELDVSRLVLRGASLIGSVGFPFDCWPSLIEQVRSGELPAERIVTSTVPLHAAIEDGFRVLADGDGAQVKIIIDIRGS